MVDFELGLYHACRPQSYSQNICLCGHVIWRRDAGHVVKETMKRGRGGGRERETRVQKGERQRRNVGEKKREEGKFNNLKINLRSKENKIRYQLRAH